ncbi:dihydroxyacetone kinase subunit DhaK [Canibacter zhoujuaniae]|uniref:dihydroxyacetone kinase subunit DhaK n=1 Tax=Canibacter zhoujuaniae TaxID=2708343 RepID=UPI00141EB634|nr:dihydroxyacetone kinase subunit DhaK [Canibacter zhoujuaniae]
MKKLINDPEQVVAESLAGVAAAHDSVRVDFEHQIVYRAAGPKQGKVGVISGGGSGHEPLHGGYVGEGMLDAAVAGQMFTSPTPDQVAAAIKGVDGGAGVLQIIKNYTGDVMNFEMAAELANAETGVEVASVIVNDDVAVEDSSFTAGRRGVGLTVLLEKIVGAAAEAGQDLKSVKKLAEEVIANGRSMGVALTSCTVPHVGRPTFELPEDQMEMGVGIHGEPGRRRVALAPAADIAKEMVDSILEELDFQGSETIVMVNGLGATPQIELYLMYGEVAKLLAERGVKVARNLVGNYITALDMAGCSLTILKANDEILKLWDAPVKTPALRWGK